MTPPWRESLDEPQLVGTGISRGPYGVLLFTADTAPAVGAGLPPKRSLLEREGGTAACCARSGLPPTVVSVTIAKTTSAREACRPQRAACSATYQAVALVAGVPSDGRGRAAKK